VNYFKTQFVLMVIVAVLVWGALFLLKVKYAFLLAILTGVFSIVPNYGMVLSSMMVSLVAIFDGVALYSKSLPLMEGIIVLVILILINKMVDLFISPLFLGKTNNINSGVLFVVVMLSSIVFGIWGAILSVPILLMIKTTIDHLATGKR